MFSWNKYILIVKHIEKTAEMHFLKFAIKGYVENCSGSIRFQIYTRQPDFPSPKIVAQNLNVCFNNDFISTVPIQIIDDFPF